ncbi:esterase/lipase family protein [Salinithrix halophila]|uniref:Esterase/lipase family protein n=1 Tax=Salinithrix halophila TaxID=1485204 RepID=A0ABV8JF17_9BACL
MKKWLVLCLTFALLFSLTIPPTKTEAGSIFPIVIGKPGKPGTIYFGEPPENPDPEKPVVVFVQGLYNSASIWRIYNDMPIRTRNAGYETAFVELNDAGGTPKSNWDNGKMLADQLQKISDHFEGKKLVVVGYSKGGIDTQTALVHYGKYPLVSNVITLGSPHQGSPLADLAYSNWIRWLSSLLGTRNEAVYSLQTGYMNHFRSQTDSKDEIRQNTYLTLTGNSWGWFLSPTWYGGLYMGVASDGIVPVSSASLPYGKRLAVRKWHHLNIFKGGSTFDVFKDYLTTSRNIESSKPMVKGPEKFVAKEPAASPMNSDSFIRGGEQSGAKSEAFSVENGVKSITVDWMSERKLDSVEVTEPSGRTRTVKVKAVQDKTVFKGAWHHLVQVDTPQPGQWKVNTSTSQKTAYALLVKYDTNKLQQLHLKQKGNQPRWKLVNGSSDSKRQKSGANRPTISKVKTRLQVNFIPEKGNKGKQRVLKVQSSKQTTSNDIQIPDKGPGVYNMTLDVKGVDAKGMPFTRTIVESVYMDGEGKVY